MQFKQSSSRRSCATVRVCVCDALLMPHTHTPSIISSVHRTRFDSFSSSPSLHPLCTPIASADWHRAVDQFAVFQPSKLSLITCHGRTAKCNRFRFVLCRGRGMCLCERKKKDGASPIIPTQPQVRLVWWLATFSFSMCSVNRGPTYDWKLWGKQNKQG